MRPQWNTLIQDTAISQRSRLKETDLKVVARVVIPILLVVDYVADAQMRHFGFKVENVGELNREDEKVVARWSFF